MYFALVYENSKVFCAFTKEKAIKLLEDYIKKYGDVGKAVEAIEFDLKKKTLYK